MAEGPEDRDPQASGPGGDAGQSDRRPGTEELRGWVGFKLDAISGATAGRVEGAFVDSDDGEPRWLAIRAGRLGRRSAVPAELAAAGVKRVWVPYEKDLIRSGPVVDPAAGLTVGKELELCDHYRLPAGAERRGELADRDLEAISSRPLES